MMMLGSNIKANMQLCQLKICKTADVWGHRGTGRMHKLIKLISLNQISLKGQISGIPTPLGPSKIKVIQEDFTILRGVSQL